MTETENKKLRAYYHSLLEQRFVFEEAKESYIESQPAFLLRDEIARIRADFPGLLPPFVLDHHFDFRGDTDTFYKVPGLRSYIGIAVARLKVAIETPENSPVTEQREFGFIKDLELRKVLERDYSEIQRAYVANCWKSVIILSGGAIEAILADLLMQHSARAVQATRAPKQQDIAKWSLADLINVSVDLQLVTGGVERLSHSLREYRNLIHPGNETRNKLKFGLEEAKIAIEVLHILHRDLSP